MVPGQVGRVVISRAEEFMDQSMVRTAISRRKLLGAIPLSAAGLALAAGARSLPASAQDAEQVLRVTSIEGKHFDLTRNLYEANGMGGYAWEPLVWLDADYTPTPGGADSWETSADGLTWTFKLRQNAKWSDGTAITADDWVYSIKRMLDPAIANPYAWFYASIKNAAAITAGTASIDDLGVAKTDDYTLTITTEQPTAYFLMVMGFLATIAPKHMIDAHGDAWANDPATALSNGPFMVKEWNKGQSVIFEVNPHYEGPAKGAITRVEETLIPQTMTSTIPMFQANEIDNSIAVGADLIQAQSNPELKDLLSTFSAFTTYYMYFNTDNPPFNDLKVRQAFSHAIDRDSLCNQVMQGLEVPAYTMLPLGFPYSQADNPEIQAIQAYNPDLAKQLLAEAGFPDGEGFPELELWTRQGQIVRESEAIQHMLNDVLGVKVTPKDVERSLYMDTLGKHEITLGLIQWAQDYADPTNFLDWWTTQARHTWKNDQFNELIHQAAGELDTTKRGELYHQAERILIEDVAAVFIGNPVQGELWQSWVQGLKARADGARIHYGRYWNDVSIAAH
jgi:peptide/nickel transport system substrate-binding protein/oligopeptide transport system substrate-binding protein